MESVVAAPRSPLVAGLVGRYVGWSFEGLQPGSTTNLPGRHLAIVIDLTATLANGTPAAIAGGLSVSPSRSEHNGTGFGLRIEVSPVAARAVFGVPASELRGAVPLAELWGPGVLTMLEALVSAGDWTTRWGVLDRALAAHAADVQPRPEFVHAWRLLLNSAGTMKISDLAAEVGFSRRHLVDVFGREMGLSPKQAARLVRFEHASARVARGQDLASVAFHSGYSDQSHLDREWKALTDRSPTEWLHEELRDHPALA